jgi:hypothetical protein
MPRPPPSPGLSPIKPHGGEENSIALRLASRTSTGSLPPRLFAGEGLGMGGAGPSTGLVCPRLDSGVYPSPTLFVGEGGTRVSAAG